MVTPKPGTVAVATVKGERNVRVIRVEDTARPWVTARCDHRRDDEVTDVRPLVVLDVADPSQTVDTLRSAACLASKQGDLTVALALQNYARQIEAQTRLPKPDEPTGLGAVVEDADGLQWVLNNPAGVAKWSRVNAAAEGLARDYRVWDDIDAVRILADGVQP